jgi:hypothetical protein
MISFFLLYPLCNSQHKGELMKSLLVLLLISMSTFAFAENLCQGYGPQTPRDITDFNGSNTVVFDTAPERVRMNLCNIHFHKGAEHKGPEFDIYTGPGKFGGYACNNHNNLEAHQLNHKTPVSCKDLKVGDTIEIHWVFTSCNVEPGAGLGSCLSDACANPQLRVEAEVFKVVSDNNALKFQSMGYAGKINGYHQPKMLSDERQGVEFLGSTTGPSFSQAVCSPLQVTWNVRPSCKLMDINSISKWCENNIFEEDAAHGVRELVTAPELLSEIY